MFLKEFFGKSIDIDKEMSKNQDDQGLNNDLFWYIIDHDRLHKDYFHPIAQKIHKANKSKNLDKEKLTLEFMPMVKKGCQEFYKEHNLPGHIADNFDKEFMKEMCERLYDHYKDDIVNGNHYKIGV
jgi:hypothetical protein